MYNQTPEPPPSCVVPPDVDSTHDATHLTETDILSRQLRIRNAEILNLQQLNKKLRRDRELEQSARESLQTDCTELRKDLIRRDEIISRQQRLITNLNSQVEPLLKTLVAIRNFCSHRRDSSGLCRAIIALVESAPMEGG